ncbi:MAG: hypothetical protein WAW30_01215 [Patescibacteria group bacterium]
MNATPAQAKSGNGYLESFLFGLMIPTTSLGTISGTAWWSVTMTSIPRA